MTTKLSDAQLVILSAACQREKRNVYPIAAKLTGGALRKVLTSLLAKALIEEIPAKRDDHVWRSDAEGARFTLRATSVACEALGIEATTQGAEHAEKEAEIASESRRSRGRKSGALAEGNASVPSGKKSTRARCASPRPQDRASAVNSRPGTKQALLIEMLRRPEGAMIDEIAAATGWQKHTIRGAMASALKKKLGLTIASAKVEGRGRVYRIL